MNSARWLLLVPALLVLPLTGCDLLLGPKCDPSSCPSGCCDAEDRCQLGNTSNACGAKGGQCAACSVTQNCQLGLCITTTGATGATGATGGMDPPGTESCAMSGRCTRADGSCGAACSTGCCAADGSGSCRPGTSSNTCGQFGEQCQSCSGSCTATVGGGLCAGSCNPSNCAGCCLNGSCVGLEAQTNEFCGSGAVVCGGCQSGQACVAGSCKASVKSCSGCSETECCDTTTGNCSYGLLNGQCGANGKACQACTGGKVCGLGSATCVTPGAGQLGDNCSGDYDCAGGARYKQPFCIGWMPGGVCSELCGGNISCSPGVCLGDTATEPGFCLASCSAFKTPCRADGETICDQVAPGVGACVPRCGQSLACESIAGVKCDTGTGLCCGISTYACCSTGTPCTGSAENGGTSVCQTDGYCS